MAPIVEIAMIMASEWVPYGGILTTLFGYVKLLMLSSFWYQQSVLP